MRLSIFCVLLPFIGLAQQTIDAEQFFARGLSTFKTIEKTTREEVNFPWIDKYDFRTETRDFDWDEQEYTCRLSPSTAKIRSAQKAYYEAMANAPDFDGQEMYCDHIFSLHQDWLSLFIINEKISAINELAVILNDKQTIYERMAGTYDLDVQELVKLQTEKSELKIDINKLELEREYLLNKYNLQNQEIDFGGFITMEILSEYLESNPFSLSESEIVDLETTYEKQLLTREIELESSEKKQLIDFVQLKYNGPHSDLLQERLSVGLGFQLSNSGSQKLKMQELQIEQEELDRKSERNRQEKQTELMVLENQLQSDMQAFSHFQSIMQEERTQLQQLGRKVAQKEGSSPLFLLEIEERHLSMKIKSLDKREDLLQDYLKYLQASDDMCQADFVNYLK